MEAGYEMLLNHPQEGPNGICVFMHRTEYSRWKCIEAAIVEATGKPPLITPIASVRFAGVQTSLTLLGMHPPAPTPENAGMNQPCLIKSAAWCADGRLQVPVGTGQKNDLVVMAGDFNAFPFDSGILAIRQAGLNDTYATTNRRPGPTWSFWPRIFRWARIDYIFVSSEVGVRKAVPCAIPGSDHHAVIADLLRPD
jgi:exonuclease III